MTEPILRRRRRIMLDDRLVGWVVKLKGGGYRAYVERPDFGYINGDGRTREDAMREAWSARCVLNSVVQPTEEET